MQENFLIGIGGTGSRVLEAFIHCCAAGYGPTGKVHILLIDPDRGNGNLTRTKTLLQQYRTLRKSFKREDANRAFQTDLVIPEGEGQFIWSIFKETDQTLAKYIGYDNLKGSDESRPLADVADLLFTQLELGTALNEGFRGHPSIGAVVMANLPIDEYPFKMLKDNMPQGANEARVFVVGSIFGGTGAAGFPTLGAEEVLKFNPELQTMLGENRSKVLLGGALVLPYFHFKVDNTKDEKMFVTPLDFPVATKAALHYYNDKQLAFDQYYFIGDSLGQEVGNFSTGNASQENRPHYVELASALAAFDFFGQDIPKEGAEKNYFIASRETPQVNWDELPLTRYSDRLAERRAEFRDALTEFALFSYTYLTVGRKYLKMRHKDARDYPWYKDSFATYQESNPKDNPAHGDNAVLHELAASYGQLFLKWVTDLDDREHVQLIDREMLLEAAAANAPAAGTKPELRLKDPEQHRENLGRLRRGQVTGKNYDHYFANLNASFIADGTQHAAHKYLNIFYRAARAFNQANAALR